MWPNLNILIALISFFSFSSLAENKMTYFLVSKPLITIDKLQCAHKKELFDQMFIPAYFDSASSGVWQMAANFSEAHLVMGKAAMPVLILWQNDILISAMSLAKKYADALSKSPYGMIWIHFLNTKVSCDYISVFCKSLSFITLKRIGIFASLARWQWIFGNMMECPNLGQYPLLQTPEGRTIPFKPFGGWIESEMILGSIFSTGCNFDAVSIEV